MRTGKTLDMATRTGTPRMRRPIAAVATGILGLVAAIASGLAMIPRVRFVEVLAVVASAIGAGAALALAVVQLRQARADLRSGSSDMSVVTAKKPGGSVGP